MKLINSSVEILPQVKDKQSLYEAIELAGRVAYKSEDMITADSAEKFVDMLKRKKHNAALEHGTIYLTVPLIEGGKPNNDATNYYSFFQSNPYSVVNADGKMFYITTNLRVLVENHRTSYLKYITPCTDNHERRITVRFTCDRGVSHELVRHRVFSFLQESTRFCNYSKDKFNNQLTFIIPQWAKQLPEGTYNYLDGQWLVYNLANTIQFNADEHTPENLLLWGLSNDESYYLKMVKDFNLKPQEARQILPNALKTEVIMTGTVSQWDAFFNLRCAEDAHPDMRKLALELRDKIQNDR